MSEFYIPLKLVICCQSLVKICWSNFS